MKKLVVFLIMVFGTVGGLVWASTVTTTDGKNFIVTDDGGYSSPYINGQIVNKVEIYNSNIPTDLSSLTSAQQQYQTDHESLIVWNGIEQMAVNAASAKGYANAVCTDGTGCWSGTCTNSVCE